MNKTKAERVTEIIEDVKKTKDVMIGINQDVAGITKKENKFIIYRHNLNAVIFETENENDLVKYLMISLTM